VKSFATLPVPERRLLIEQVAARQNVVPVIVEKDFWVCWLLRVLFACPLAVPLIFKGGTSLSKVFAVIARFSEDVDLAIPPALLGLVENELEDTLDEARSSSQRTKQLRQLDSRCAAWVKEELQPRLEAAIRQLLGETKGTQEWLSFEVDPRAHTPNLWFSYPSALALPGGYVAKKVKLELGMLTRQQPTGDYTIAPMLAATLGQEYEDFPAKVVALELARTFWEKATILHAEYHRPIDQPIRDRSARHYADFESLWSDPRRNSSMSRLDLLDDVLRHKSRFFSSSWANYGTARPGTFRLVPPESRRSELAKDYGEMEPMFLTTPLSFDELLSRLVAAEEDLNRR
jgi:hypothetical protein